jgi:hypothetical protein
MTAWLSRHNVSTSRLLGEESGPCRADRGVAVNQLGLDSLASVP